MIVTGKCESDTKRKPFDKSDESDDQALDSWQRNCSSSWHTFSMGESVDDEISEWQKTVIRQLSLTNDGMTTFKINRCFLQSLGSFQFFNVLLFYYVIG